MNEIFSNSIRKQVTAGGVIAVLTLNKKEDISPTIESLLTGGISVIELTLRTPIAIEAINIITKDYPEILCGVGTILTPEQVVSAKEAGADFGVAPGLNRKVLESALKENFSFAPGISTASDIESALEYGCKMLKFFPAESMGGFPYLKHLNGPYMHLGLSYIPLGGINETNLVSYARESIIAGVGGSWIASQQLIADQKWKEIIENSKRAMKIYQGENK